MKPYISMITLGVTDLHRSVRFYQEGLGLHTEGIMGEENILGRLCRLFSGSGWPLMGNCMESGFFA